MGMYARYHVFRVDDEGSIVPVRHPDPIRLSDLVDYERERTIILDNTRALAAGLPAANILLTGDAGTGKSSTVKAVVNELAPRGMGNGNPEVREMADFVTDGVDENGIWNACVRLGLIHGDLLS